MDDMGNLRVKEPDTDLSVVPWDSGTPSAWGSGALSARQENTSATVTTARATRSP